MKAYPVYCVSNIINLILKTVVGRGTRWGGSRDAGMLGACRDSSLNASPI